MSKFPKDLAKYVFTKWHNLIGGIYVPPVCPPEKDLREIMETCYLASCATEEGRFPKFNVVVIESVDVSNETRCSGQWVFSTPKPFNVSEMTRLLPVTDLRKSAVLVGWDAEAIQIYGLVDLGTSWHRARIGLGYNYTYPNSLIIQIDRPGRIKAYQGRFSIATLSAGQLTPSDGNWMHLFLHETANSGCKKMGDDIEFPDYESPREFMEFQFMALWNTYVAIANSISLAEHGGTLIIVPDETAIAKSEINIKYECISDRLRQAFVAFMNARHIMGDLIEIDQDNHWVPPEAINKTELSLRDTYDQLVEATRFIAALAGCDGAIVITDDLRLIGFGAEIKSTLNEKANVFDIKQEFGKSHKKCDIEQFGMRHRSAVKFSSQTPDCCILTVSQDGPISAIWNKNGDVHVKKSVNLTNMNIALG